MNYEEMARDLVYDIVKSFKNNYEKDKYLSLNYNGMKNGYITLVYFYRTQYEYSSGSTDIHIDVDNDFDYNELKKQMNNIFRELGLKNDTSDYAAFNCKVEDINNAYLEVQNNVAKAR